MTYRRIQYSSITAKNYIQAASLNVYLVVWQQQHHHTDDDTEHDKNDRKQNEQET